jgi:hypothetical protein
MTAHLLGWFVCSIGLECAGFQVVLAYLGSDSAANGYDVPFFREGRG